MMYRHMEPLLQWIQASINKTTVNVIIISVNRLPSQHILNSHYLIIWFLDSWSTSSPIHSLVHGCIFSILFFEAKRARETEIKTNQNGNVCEYACVRLSMNQCGKWFIVSLLSRASHFQHNEFLKNSNEIQIIDSLQSNIVVLFSWFHSFFYYIFFFFSFEELRK